MNEAMNAKVSITNGGSTPTWDDTKRPWTLSGVLIVLTVLALACGGPTATPTTTPMPVYDYKSLTDDLGSAGAHVGEPTGFSVGGRSITINGGTIQVYEFPDERAADTEARYVSPDGYNITVPLGGDRTMSVHSDWLAPPHYYKKGRVIVLYVGDDPSLVEVLQGMLGPVFAGPTTPTPTATATPTPSVAREWNLEGIQVDGSTVTVLLYVFAGIDVWATLDDERADEVRPTIPTIEYVFLNVTPGQHTVDVRDVVGFKETAEVVVPTPEIPDWLAGLIRKLESEPVANPPASITRYEYNGQTVYFLPQRCCDIFSDLYESDGNIIGHPDGGIAGQGDGRVPDFFEVRRNESVIWRDQRTYDSGLVQVPAPIESVEVLILESFPQQYMLVVVSGLPNGCASFAGYRLERSGDTIKIEMVNWKPADESIACTEEYRTLETNILLGIDFESGETYTVEVNDVTDTFIAQ